MTSGGVVQIATAAGNGFAGQRFPSETMERVGEQSPEKMFLPLLTMMSTCPARMEIASLRSGGGRVEKRTARATMEGCEQEREKPAAAASHASIRPVRSAPHNLLRQLIRMSRQRPRGSSGRGASEFE
jgi:hypothetical protein